AYFEKRRRLNTFAIMVWIDSENKEYREQLHNIIWSICNEYTWCLPAHFTYDKKTSYSLYSQQNEEVVIDLFAAETGFALAEILQLIGEHLNPLKQNQFRSEEHTSELQSRENLVCRLLLEKKKQLYELEPHFALRQSL